MKAALPKVCSNRTGLMAIAALLLAVQVSGAAAQTFPSRPIRLIVPFAPGGGNDIMGRFIAQKMSERIGQQTIVDNRAGADGIIGTEIAARSAPDGYTILIISTSYTQNAAIHKLPYDPVKSLTPISMVGTSPNVIYSAPGLPADAVQKLIALAKSKTGAVRYASSGVGGFNHFGGELFNSMAGVKMTYVPYKGGGPSMVDVISGQVEVGFGTLIQALPHLRSGKLRAIAVGSPKRSALMPDVPTISESGLPGYDCSVWWGIMGPAGLPGPIVTRLNAEIGAVMKDAEMAKRLQAEAAEAIIADPDALVRLIASELEKWARVAKETGIRAE
jgi:tripartite-type tricarboxylate transporter receptor subunit TctC